jgi:hypothetical protein
MAQEELKLDCWVSCFKPTYQEQIFSEFNIQGLRLNGKDKKDHEIAHYS